MFYWSLIFLFLALIAGILGFTNLAGGTAAVGQVLCGIFLVLWMITAFSRSLGGRLR